MSTSSVEFGAFLPRWDECATPEGWRRIASAAEKQGFAWVGRGDRVVFPDRPADPTYVTRPASETFSVLASVAEVTETIRLGTNVCVVPYRHPLHLVKQVFTLDCLSDGRFEFGIGVGWLESEFEALGVPFSERGSRTDEFLDIYAAACERDTVAFDGPHHSFETVGFSPRPRQAGGPPLWIGGSASPTFRRAGERGVGWTIGGRSPEEIEEGRERLLAAWRAFDRTGEPEIAVNVDGFLTDDAVEEPARLVGDAETILTDVAAYRAAGVTRINLQLSSDPRGGTLSVDERVEQIERFGDEVLPSL